VVERTLKSEHYYFMLSERLELKIQESCINKIYLAMVVLIAEDTTSGMFYLTK